MSSERVQVRMVDISPLFSSLQYPRPGVPFHQLPQPWACLQPCQRGFQVEQIPAESMEPCEFIVALLLQSIRTLPWTQLAD